ncbi:MAG: alpha/beta fold hydrolase [Myxococcota bacterium]
MRPLPSNLSAVFPWEPSYIDQPGGRQAFIDAGPRSDVALVAVHGNPTWSFYWRAMIAHVAPHHRVIVPDHIGCGRSDKPQDWTYRLQDHVDNLERLLDTLGVERIVLAVHDWGGAIGMGVATRRPDRIAGLLVTNTAAWRSQRIPASIASCRIPGFGPLAVRGFNGFVRVATVRATAKGLSPEASAGLLWPYDSWENRIATLRFVEDIPLRPRHPSYAELARIEAGLVELRDKPALICWGGEDFCFDHTFLRGWTQRFPKATMHLWDDVGHYVMEDAPSRTLAAADALLGRVEGW